jgi:hypothetical protein
MVYDLWLAKLCPRSKVGSQAPPPTPPHPLHIGNRPTLIQQFPILCLTFLNHFPFQSRKALKDRRIDRQTGRLHNTDEEAASRQTDQRSSRRHKDRRAALQTSGWQYRHKGGSTDRRVAIQTGGRQ